MGQKFEDQTNFLALLVLPADLGSDDTPYYHAATLDIVARDELLVREEGTRCPARGAAELVLPGLDPCLVEGAG